MLFKIRELVWSIVAELENILYPYRTDPAEDFYYIVV